MASFKTGVVSTLLLSAALLHCGRDKTPEPAAPAPAPVPVTVTPPPLAQQMTPASGAAPPAAAEATAAPERLADEQIFKVIDQANTFEVDQAKFAQTKARSAKVKNFAALIIQQHGKARDKGSKLATKLGVTPADTALSTEQKSDSEALLLALKNAPAADFDRAYMDGQVSAHQKLLSTLDDRLVPSVSDAELKALLEEMRATAASHLTDAQKIQAELQAAAEKR